MPTIQRGVKLGLLLGLALAGPAGWPLHAERQSAAATAYVCPMHPDVVSRTPGTCPRCRMTLAPADPFDAREYIVDADPHPAAPRAGEAFRLRLTVREPSTRAIVREFVEVHEQRYHLFVVSQDLEHYQHVHPVQEADGSYVVDLTLPRPGIYRLFSDFLPLGGTPQIVPGTLVTAAAPPAIAAASARLVPDIAPRAAGDMRVSITLPADGLTAGRDETLRYHVVDARTSEPVMDLEPYLAAFGHTLVLSEDTLHYVHAHPIERPPGAEGPPRGGPDLTFKALLPKPGRYRAWTQLKRRGVVTTVTFTFDVRSPAAG